MEPGRPIAGGLLARPLGELLVDHALDGRANRPLHELERETQFHVEFDRMILDPEPARHTGAIDRHPHFGTNCDPGGRSGSHRRG